ncbi:chymotrypsin-like protease CTRL-1 [Epargyreus clarus]|uniref:chymotrypsin-like protease CTRL-1 n=1 Tax=Epargyreus clarus TaxID=520877 RepID=UPI003C2C1102
MFPKCVFLFILIQVYGEPDRRVITTLKYSKHYMRPAIVNGEPVVSGQIPYIVSIKEPTRFVANRYVWRNLCGGSIISKRKVLTAAHCFEGNNFYYAKRPHILRVVAGNLHNDVMYTPNTNTSTQWRKIERLVLHWNFNFPNNDIALFTVDKPWNFGNNVDYVILARKNMDYPRTCMSAGFGRIGHGTRSRLSQVMLLAPIHTLPRRQCSKIWEMNMNTFICSNSMLTDVARGDSGGPLACRWTLDPAEKANRDLLVGVVSGKNFDYTTLFTRVSAFHDWIARGNSCNLRGITFIIPILHFVAQYHLFSFCSVIEQNNTCFTVAV